MANSNLLSKRWLGLWAAMVAFSSLFLWTYPPNVAGVEDEVGFINQAVVWSRGAMTAEAAGFGPSVADFVSSPAQGGHHVAWRNPGRSLLILPFYKVAGWRAIYVSGLLIHLITALIAALVLDYFTRRPIWAILVLFHPTLALYSRTIMGDVPAGTMLLAALFVAACTERSGLWVGALVGAAAVMRYQAGICLPFLCAWLWRSDRRHAKRDALLAAAGGGAMGMMLLIYNKMLYGSFAGVTSQGYFALSFFGERIAFYALCLSVVWPGMLLAPILDRSKFRALSMTVVLPVGMPFLFYYFHDTMDSKIGTLIVGQRLIQPILGVLIVSYSIGLDRVSRRFLTNRRLSWLGALVGVFGIISTAVMFRAHERRLQGFVQVRGDLNSALSPGEVVFANSVTWKAVGVVEPGAPHFDLRPYPPKTIPFRPPSSDWCIAFKPRSAEELLPGLQERFVEPYHLKERSLVASGTILYEHSTTVP